MPSKATFHVFIPCLLNSLKSWHQDFLFESKAPHLSTLLIQHKVFRNNYTSSLNDAFFSMLGNSQASTAIYRHRVQLDSDRGNLVCADPIHLDVAMNDVTLTEKITNLSDDEAKELITLLNIFFKEDSIEFVFGSSQYWYAELADNEVIDSNDIDSVLLKNVMGKLPKSNQRNWHVIQNEIQMLLHSSDVNRQRELAGLKPVNSLWFWGGGSPIQPQIEIEKIYSSDETSSKLTGLLFANAANCEWQALPKNSNLLLGDCTGSKRVLLLDQLFNPAIQSDVDEFQRQLSYIDETFIKPLLLAWQQNQIELIIDCCDGKVFSPEKIPAWKFWLKPKNLRELAHETY